MIIAKIIAEKNASISRGQLYLILSAATICMLVTLVIFFIKLPSYWLINRLLFLPIILGIIASFVIVGKKTQFTKLDNALKWLGGITLEIYLTHEKILGICDHVLSRINCNEVLGSIIANVIAVIMAVCLAKLLSLLTDLIIKQTKQSTKQTS